MVSGSAEGLALQAMAGELGWQLQLRVWTDSSGAKAAVSRRGLGKMRHMELRYLWVQEAVRRRRIQVKKILGTHNPADHLTKPRTRFEIEGLLQGVGATFAG